MNNAVLGQLPKRLIITMVKNTDFLGTMSSNPYNFRHYDVTHFAMYITLKQVPPKAWHLIWAVKRQPNGIQNPIWRIGHSSFEHGTSDKACQVYKRVFHASVWLDARPCCLRKPYIGSRVCRHTFEMKFGKPLPEPLVCLLYLEYDSAVLIDALRQVTTDY